MWTTVIKILFGLALASLITGAAGTLIQISLNFAALQSANPYAIGGTFTAQHWRIVLQHDLVHFAPLFALIAAGSFIPAFALAELLTRRVGARVFWFSLGGLAGLMTALILINQSAPMPNLFVVTRTWTGLLALSTSGLFGGLVFALVTPVDRRTGGLGHADGV